MTATINEEEDEIVQDQIDEDEFDEERDLVDEVASDGQESSEEDEIIEIISDDENNQGECVGFDGESDRSEDEEMNEEDREFLDDESATEGLSHLALLNAGRYEDDEAVLDRLVEAKNLFFLNNN